MSSSQPSLLEEEPPARKSKSKSSKKKKKKKKKKSRNRKKEERKKRRRSLKLLDDEGDVEEAPSSSRQRHRRSRSNSAVQVPKTPTPAQPRRRSLGSVKQQRDRHKQKKKHRPSAVSHSMSSGDEVSGTPPWQLEAHSLFSRLGRRRRRRRSWRAVQLQGPRREPVKRKPVPYGRSQSEPYLPGMTVQSQKQVLHERQSSATKARQQMVRSPSPPAEHARRPTHRRRPSRSPESAPASTSPSSAVPAFALGSSSASPPADEQVAAKRRSPSPRLRRIRSESSAVHTKKQRSQSPQSGPATMGPRFRRRRRSSTDKAKPIPPPEKVETMFKSVPVERGTMSEGPTPVAPHRTISPLRARRQSKRSLFTHVDMTDHIPAQVVSPNSTGDAAERRRRKRSTFPFRSSPKASPESSRRVFPQANDAEIPMLNLGVPLDSGVSEDDHSSGASPERRASSPAALTKEDVEHDQASQTVDSEVRKKSSPTRATRGLSPPMPRSQVTSYSLLEDGPTTPRNEEFQQEQLKREHQLFSKRRQSSPDLDGSPPHANTPPLARRDSVKDLARDVLFVKINDHHDSSQFEPVVVHSPELKPQRKSPLSAPLAHLPSSRASASTSHRATTPNARSDQVLSIAVEQADDTSFYLSRPRRATEPLVTSPKNTALVTMMGSAGRQRSASISGHAIIAMRATADAGTDSDDTTSGGSSDSILLQAVLSSALDSDGSPSRQQQRQFIKGNVLGSGAFGSVYRAIDARTGEMFAVKEMKPPPGMRAEEREAEMVKMQREVEVMRELDHPNVLKCYGGEITSQRVRIFLEIGQESVRDLIKCFGGSLPESIVAAYTRQILLGVQYLHEHDVIHRDLKGANILVGADGRLKLADFGASKVADGASLMHSFVGTPYWMAPEVVRGDGYDKSADLWSVGCCVVEMLTGSHPYQGLNHFSACYKISIGSPPSYAPELCSDALRSFLADCFQVDPASRPSAVDLLQHAFVAEL